jgi:hypothetical protein
MKGASFLFWDYNDLMTDSNFQQSLQAFVRRRPFKPFTVELVSGDRFVVDHPEALALRGAVAVYINTDGKYTLFDSTGVSQLTETVDRALSA